MRTASLALLTLLLTMPLLAGCVGAPDDAAAATGQGADGAFVPFLQQGADAARTGATTDPGPATFDLAFSVTLPGVIWRENGPIILGGAVFVYTGAQPNDDRATTTGVWRIDLATGTEELLADLEDPFGLATAFFSDGTRLFAVQGNEVKAFDPADGSPAWPAPYVFPQLGTTPAQLTNCMPGAAAGGVLYLGCVQRGEPYGTLLPAIGDNPGFVEATTVAVALDAATGEEVWRTVLAPGEGDAQLGTDHARVLIATRTALGPDHFFVEAVELLPHVLPDLDSTEGDPTGRHVVWAFDRADGRFAWSWRAPIHEPYAPSPDDTDSACSWEYAKRVDTVEYANMGLVATPDALYVKWDALRALDPATGAPLWTLPLPHDPADTCEDGYALALFDDDLYVADGAHLHRIDLEGQAIEWAVRASPGDDWDDTVNLLVAGGAVHGVTDEGRLSVHAVGDGRLLHQRRLGTAQSGGDAYLTAVGEGVLAATRHDGTVLVLGRPPAAIHPSIVASTTYPAPGATVTLDLSGTVPGARATDLEHRVNWGDGTLTPWTAEPVFAHRYTRAGDATATVHVRNSAGQEATAAHTFHVGQVAPVAPGVVQTALNADNEERTFFILGLALTAAVGAMGYGRHRRRRGRLQDELAAIQAALDMAETPVEVQAALRDRRAHVRGLLLDGKLDESQVAVLEGRIDELAKEGRLAQLDARVELLPYGMVKRVEEALADGRITAWEREQMLRTLDEETGMTKAKKREVRDLIESWFAEDAGVEA